MSKPLFFFLLAGEDAANAHPFFLSHEMGHSFPPLPTPHRFHPARF